MFTAWNALQYRRIHFCSPTRCLKINVNKDAWQDGMRRAQQMCVYRVTAVETSTSLALRGLKWLAEGRNESSDENNSETRCKIGSKQGWIWSGMKFVCPFFVFVFFFDVCYDWADIAQKLLLQIALLPVLWRGRGMCACVCFCTFSGPDCPDFVAKPKEKQTQISKSESIKCYKFHCLKWNGNTFGFILYLTHLLGVQSYYILFFYYILHISDPRFWWCAKTTLGGACIRLCVFPFLAFQRL